MWQKRRASGFAVVAVLALTAGCSGGRSLSSPAVTAGRLVPCPGSPNCVSSEAAAAEQRVWARMLDELRQFATTPEGEAELARVAGRRLSHNL